MDRETRIEICDSICDRTAGHQYYELNFSWGTIYINPEGKFHDMTMRSSSEVRVIPKVLLDAIDKVIEQKAHSTYAEFHNRTLELGSITNKLKRLEK